MLMAASRGLHIVLLEIWIEFVQWTVSGIVYLVSTFSTKLSFESDRSRLDHDFFPISQSNTNVIIIEYTVCELIFNSPYFES